MIVRTPSDETASVSSVLQFARSAFIAFMSPQARLLRFVVSGVISAMFQFAVLLSLLDAGWNRFPANLAGMVVGAQASFVLGCLFTWRDREEKLTLRRRWALFHISIAGTAVINVAVFTLSQMVVPTIVASALGIGIAAIGNFLAGDKLIFRSTAQPAAAAA